MSRHAKKSHGWLDTVAAYLTLAVAFLSLSWRLSTGKHVRREPEIAWPTGADLAYVEQLQALNDTPTVRMEARV